MMYSTLTAEKNTGSIGVTFDNAKVTFADKYNKPLTGETADSIKTLRDNIKVDFTCWVYDNQGKHKDSIKVETKTGVSLTDLEAQLNTVLNKVTLEPGEYLELRGNDYTGQLMTFKLDDSGNVFKNDTQNTSLNFTIQLNWKQFNN